MAVITRKGLRRAASNVFWFPFRAGMFVFSWFLRVALTVSILLLAALLTAGLGMGWYFYAVKSNQPMVIDPRYAVSQPPEGMTFRELWQDRFAGWAKIDERLYKSGQSKSEHTCKNVYSSSFPVAQVFVPLLRIVVVRNWPDSRMAHDAISGAKGQIAPSDLSFVDAVWWQIENETWWYWVDHLGRPCKLPPPQRPPGVSGAP